MFLLCMRENSSAETGMRSAKDKFKKIEIDADSTDLMSEFLDK